MKRYGTLGLLLYLVCFLHFSTDGMYVNGFYSLSMNYNVSTHKFINYGTIHSLFMEVSASSFTNYGAIHARDIDMNVATLSGNGTIKSNCTTNIKSDDIDYTGTISSKDYCIIKTEHFGGSATIKAPYIIIMCDDFNFTGTIEPGTQCIICTKTPFDVQMFKRGGNGVVKVAITFNNIVCPKGKDLSSYAYTKLKDNYTKFRASNVDSVIRSIRTSAVLTNMNDFTVLNEIKESLMKDEAFYKARLHQSRDTEALAFGVSLATLSSLCAYLIYCENSNIKHNGKNTQKCSDAPITLEENSESQETTTTKTIRRMLLSLKRFFF